MGLFSIILFFIYTLGLGFSLTRFTKESSDWIERQVMRVGIGLGGLVVLNILLSLIGIPLDWKIILFLSLIGPIVYAVKNPKKLFKFDLKISVSVILLFIMFSASLFMYHKGAFSYPYLENDDPWSHAVSIKFIAVEKTVFVDEFKDSVEQEILTYIDPYPPGYDSVIAIMHQTSPSLNWTIKFFNLLIISLSLLFFYYFAKSFAGGKRALIATFALFAVPAYMSHFIWAHSLIVALLFPALYCFEKMKQDGKWKYPAMVVIAGILMTQPTQSVKIGVLFGIYWGVNALLKKNWNLNVIYAGLGGIGISMLWWGTMLLQYGGLSGLKEKGFKLGVGALTVSGTASRLYTFGDFFIAKKANLINNPIGIGIVLTTLLIIAVIYSLIRYKTLLKEKNHWVIISLLWLLFTFLGIHGERLPIQLFSFRFWMLFAIPASLLIAEGWMVVTAFGKSMKIPKIAITVLLVIGILLTSYAAKYEVNTVQWTPGASWNSIDDVQAYASLASLPLGTKVFAIEPYDSFVIGFDKESCAWCRDVRKFRETILDRNATEIHTWVKDHDYEYVIVSSIAARYYGEVLGENKTKQLQPLINSMIQSEKFQVTQQTKSAIVMKVN